MPCRLYHPLLQLYPQIERVVQPEVHGIVRPRSPVPGPQWSRWTRPRVHHGSPDKWPLRAERVLFTRQYARPGLAHLLVEPTHLNRHRTVRSPKHAQHHGLVLHSSLTARCTQSSVTEEAILARDAAASSAHVSTGCHGQQGQQPAGTEKLIDMNIAGSGVFFFPNFILGVFLEDSEPII